MAKINEKSQHFSHFREEIQAYLRKEDCSIQAATGRVCEEMRFTESGKATVK